MTCCAYLIYFTTKLDDMDLKTGFTPEAPIQRKPGKWPQMQTDKQEIMNGNAESITQYSFTTQKALPATVSLFSQ